MSGHVVQEDCVGLILAGGRSVRMGRDKALLRLGGEIFIERIARTLGEVLPRVYIAGGVGRGPELGGMGLPVLKDPPGRSGPLAGLQAGLEAADGAALLVASCDAPLVPAAAFRTLLEAGKGAQADAVFCFGRDGGTAQHQPFPGLYGPDVIPAVEREWVSGRGSLQGLIVRLGTLRVLPCPCDPALLADVDEPGEYADLAAGFER